MSDYENAPRSVRGMPDSRHFGAAVVALLLSAALHALFIAKVESLPLRALPSSDRMHRFVPIEMTDVRTEPPPVEQNVDRRPLDSPEVSMPVGIEDLAAWEVSREREPPSLPLPPPAEPLIPDATKADSREVVARQDVVAIDEAVHRDEVSALPRKWLDADIPRIDQAPDIQLPVNIDLQSGLGGRFDAVAAPSWREALAEGTPDWSGWMNARAARSLPPESAPVLSAVSSEHDPLAERPEDVSQLKPMEGLLTVRVESYEGPAPDDHLYFALHIEPTERLAMAVQPRDILFVQDSSESMTPQKMDECRRGLKRWLDFMNPGDRFEVLAFSDVARPCFNRWQEYDEASRGEAFRFIERLRAEGNTDVFSSLQAALARPIEPGRSLVLVLVTDGRPTVGVTGSSDIIQAITRDNQGRVSIYSVGGGKKVNSFFLDLLSYRNRGDAIVVRGEEEIPRAMEIRAGEVRRPVLTDLSHSFSLVDSAEIFPKQLTHLFLDRPLVIHGRLPAGVDKIAFQVVGRAGSAWHDFLFVIERDQFGAGNASLRNQWSWQKAYHMIGEYLEGPSDERLEEIRSFSEQQGLVVPYGFSRAVPRRM